MHAQIAGTIDYREANDEAAWSASARWWSKMGDACEATFSGTEAEEPASRRKRFTA